MDARELVKSAASLKVVSVDAVQVQDVDVMGHTVQPPRGFGREYAVRVHHLCSDMDRDFRFVPVPTGVPGEVAFVMDDDSFEAAAIGYDDVELAVLHTLMAGVEMVPL